MSHRSPEICLRSCTGQSPDHPTPARPAERERETLLQLQRAMQRRREQGYSNTDTPRSCFELSRGEANVPDVRVYKGKRALDGLKAGDRHLVDDVKWPFCCHVC